MRYGAETINLQGFLSYRIVAFFPQALPCKHMRIIFHNIHPVMKCYNYNYDNDCMCVCMYNKYM